MEQNMFTIPSQSIFLIFFLGGGICAKLFETVLLQRKDTLWQNGLKNKAITCDNWIDKQRQKSNEWSCHFFSYACMWRASRADHYNHLKLFKIVRNSFFPTSQRRCNGCRKTWMKSEVCSPTASSEFPRVPFGKLLLTTYFFSETNEGG